MSRHRTKDDCWIIYRGEVYNVTSWLDKHPGGTQLLLDHAGEDVTVRAYMTFKYFVRLVASSRARATSL